MAASRPAFPLESSEVFVEIAVIIAEITLVEIVVGIGHRGEWGRLVQF